MFGINLYFPKPEQLVPKKSLQSQHKTNFNDANYSEIHNKHQQLLPFACVFFQTPPDSTALGTVR